MGGRGNGREDGERGRDCIDREEMGRRGEKEE